MTIKGFYYQNTEENLDNNIVFNMSMSVDISALESYLLNNGYEFYNKASYDEYIYNNFKTKLTSDSLTKYWEINHKIVSTKKYIKISCKKTKINENQIPNINPKFYHQISKIEKIRFKRRVNDEDEGENREKGDKVDKVDKVEKVDKVDKVDKEEKRDSYIIICKKNNNIIIYFKGNLDFCYDIISGYFAYYDKRQF